MSFQITDVRYRGDLQDNLELTETYRIEEYLQTVEDHQRQQEGGLKEKLLKDGIRLSSTLSPRIYKLYAEVASLLGLATPVEVFCLPDQQLNAFAALDQADGTDRAIIGITAGALEQLDDAELKSVIGHELGHLMSGTNRMLALFASDERKPTRTVLPPLGESIFLRWRKKTELSADRVGMIASQDFPAAARALVKVSFGLSSKNLNLDIDALMGQLEELKGKPHLMRDAFSSHPLLPVRLKAMECFSRSEKAFRNGFVSGPPLLSDEELEAQVDSLIDMTKRHPVGRVATAVMKAVALGGVRVLSADGMASEDELKTVIEALQTYFTDEPEREIVTDPQQVETGLKQALAIIRQEGDREDCGFLLSRLADVALADGALVEAEGGEILAIAQDLDLPPKVAYGVLIGAAQANGFKADPKMKRMTLELQQTLQRSFMK